ncbi:glycosyltransferase [Vibrio alginolyticus]|uniref:glycosyltransferase n=1 Tax=Vibrio alginolyticus TaxID=663 RepID=UPI000CE9A293|nr:glycosyltransferase [Vibrio alginolyticus]AVF67387.1 hypothetical protein AL541_25410 [Vibrio alginolyticus]
MFICLLKKLNLFLGKKLDNSGIFNLGERGVLNQKRVLISYLTDSFSIRTEKEFSTNRKECSIIASLFIDLGFIVDIIDCKSKFISPHRYDVVFGFGRPFRTALIKNDGVRILYQTEAPYHYSLKNEQARLAYFFERHKKNLPLERTGTYYKSYDFLLADKIICLGELHRGEFITKNNRRESDVYHTYPSGLLSSRKKESFSGHDDYLWFGSRGVVHKGLDVVIDAFKEMPNKRLHVCGIDRDELKRKNITTSENISVYGKISVDGDVYHDLINTCNYSILLSCSEAVPTSVLTTINSGLYPITSNSIGFSLEIGTQTDSYKVRDIINLIKELQFSTSDFKSKSSDLKCYGEKFSIEEFEKRMKNILSKVLFKL